MADNNNAEKSGAKTKKKKEYIPNEFDLEELFFKRKKLYILDGRLYIRVKNHLEELPSNKLESLVLSVLNDELRKVGKRSMIKAVADLIKLRTPDHFLPINPLHKQIAFNNGVFDAGRWSFIRSYDFDDVNEELFHTDCTYQMNFDFDMRLFPMYLDPNYHYPNQLPLIKNPQFFKNAAEIYNNSLQDATEKRGANNTVWYEYPFKTYVHYDLVKALAKIPTPNADKFFMEIANGNPAVVERIYQMIGYILVPGNEAKAYFLFQKEPDSGKTILGNFLEGYFPKNKCTSLDIKRLGGQFLPDALSSSCLNLSMDLPNGKMYRESIAVLKMLTGNDLITQEVKFKDARPYRGRCKFVFSTNFELEMQEYDQAFLNRTICIPFTKSIPKSEQDPELLNKLNNERAGITAKALACYYFLRENNFKFAGSDKDKSDKNKIEPLVKYSIDPNDIIKEFAKYRCMFTDNENDIVYSSDLHSAYMEHCRKRGLPVIMSLNSFSQRFRYLFSGKIDKDRKHTSGMNRNHYKNLKLLDEPYDSYPDK